MHFPSHFIFTEVLSFASEEEEDASNNLKLKISPAAQQEEEDASNNSKMKTCPAAHALRFHQSLQGDHGATKINPRDAGVSLSGGFVSKISAND